MDSEIENLVLEHLRTMRGKLDKMDNDLGDLRHRMSSVGKRPACPTFRPII